MDKIPNLLSGFRLLMAPLFLFLFIQDDLLFRGISLIVFAIAAITDAVDGYLARKYDVESEVGIFLDPLADKFLTFAGFVCLPFLDASQFPWWAVALIVLRDVGITVLRIYTKKKNITLETRNTAKIKTAIQMTFLYITLFTGFLLLFGGNFGDVIQSIFSMNIFYWGMMIVTAITVYSGIEYIVVNRKILGSDSSP